MTNYEIHISELSGTEGIKRINDDGSISFIPKDSANSDYQRYLEEQANDQSL
jgi:hypothetical protein